MGLRAKSCPNCDTAHAKINRSNTFSRPACRVFGCYNQNLSMSDFTLYDGDFGQNKVSVLPTLQDDRLIDLQMYLCPNSDNLEETEEFILTYNYRDVVLLRDYLTSIINLFDKLNNETQKS